MTKEEYWKEVIRKQVAKRCTQKRIRDRDGPGCKYCGSGKEDGEWWDLHLDHVHPKSRGGGNEDENLVLACGDCNRRKYNHISEEWGNLKRGRK
jgi:5-methylcytosine-specific restriction endonuclease McrA